MKSTNKSTKNSLLKQHEIAELQLSWPNYSEELLKGLHILTLEGRLNADSRRKIKQVLHLFQLVKPGLESVREKNGKVVVLDVGAGKNYLGFILYDLFLKHHSDSQLHSIESRLELVKASEQLAEELKFLGMKFHVGNIQDFFKAESKSKELESSIDMITALHCCDTGTDDAILLGLDHAVPLMALVPCCQAEVARLLKAAGRAGADGLTLTELWSHPIHAREFGSHLTNVLRCLVLESCGYKVRVTELVGWEHSLKNEFIFAEKTQPSNPRARKRLEAFLDVFKIKNRLVLGLESREQAG